MQGLAALQGLGSSFRAVAATFSCFSLGLMVWLFRADKDARRVDKNSEHAAFQLKSWTQHLAVRPATPTGVNVREG